MKITFLITAGPTVEDIDPVRFISNRATGKLGVAIASTAISRGHKVVLIHGPVSESVLTGLPKSKRLKIIAVRSAAEMHRAVIKHVKTANVAVMNAAVADFTPAELSTTKLKKAEQGLVLHLKPTVDILKELGRIKTKKQTALTLIGFALETGKGSTLKARRASQLAEAQRKLHDKNADAIILDAPHTMGADNGDFTIIERGGALSQCRMSKQNFAVEIVKLGERFQRES